MLTKRTMLAAGALALAMMVAACSKDRAGGATGVDGTPSAPEALAPPPAAIATPPTPEGIVPSGDGGGGSAAKVIATSYADGHQVVLSEVTTNAGAKLRRVTFDGVLMADFTGATGDGPIDATAYADGQVFLQDAINLGDARSIVIPPQYLGLAPPPSDGPQRQMAFPCGHELALFGAASLWVDVALMWAKVQPGSIAAWIDLRAAITALGAASWNLFLCLQAAW